MDNKKTIIASIIGVVWLVVLVVGATFAYFTTVTSNDEGVTNVTGKTDAIGSISLTNPTSDLHITLSALDMSEDNKNTAYYATDDATKNYDTKEVQRDIAVATVTGGEDTTYYECSATINISVTGTMVSGLQYGDAYIQFEGLLTNKVVLTKTLSKASYAVEFRLNKENIPNQKLSASVVFNNSYTNQNAIAGKEINIAFSNSDLTCNVVEAPEPSEGTAFAIYSEDDNSLRFYKNNDVVSVGNTYNELTVTEIYTGFEDSTGVPWYKQFRNILTVEFVDEITPLITARWFNGMNGIFEANYKFDVTNLNVSNVSDMSSMFSGIGVDSTTQSVTIIGMENWDTSKVTDMSYMFFDIGETASAVIDLGDISNWDVSNVTNMQNMFQYTAYWCQSLTTGDLSKWDTSNVTNMTSMFAGTGEYTNWSLDLSGWDVSKVSNYDGFNDVYEIGQSKVTPPNFNTTS